MKSNPKNAVKIQKHYKLYYIFLSNYPIIEVDRTLKVGYMEEGRGLDFF